MEKIATYKIYVVHDGRAYKIGYTYDMFKRKKGIQTGNSGAVKEIYLFDFQVDETQIKLLETNIHKRYLHKQTESNGEWFNLDETDLKNVKLLLENSSSIIMNLRDTILEVVLGTAKNRKNLLLDNPMEREKHLMLPIRKQCAETFAQEFFLDSHKQALNLDLKVSELPQAPKDFGGRTRGKTNIWAKTFGFTPNVAEDFIWKQYCIRYQLDYDLQKEIPTNLTIRDWLGL